MILGGIFAPMICWNEVSDGPSAIDKFLFLNAERICGPNIYSSWATWTAQATISQNRAREDLRRHKSRGFRSSAMHLGRTQQMEARACRDEAPVQRRAFEPGKLSGNIVCVS